MRPNRILTLGSLALCTALIGAAPHATPSARSPVRRSAAITLDPRILGIFTVKTDQLCEWNGSASGGVQPYRFNWTITSSVHGTIDPYPGSQDDPDVIDYDVDENNGATIQLTLEVWDANNSYASITRTVTVAYGGSWCVA